jgi:hypothetical protein
VVALVTGLALDGTGFEVLAGEQRIGSRWMPGAEDVALWEGLAAQPAHRCGPELTLRCSWGWGAAVRGALDLADHAADNRLWIAGGSAA